LVDDVELWQEDRKVGISSAVLRSSKPVPQSRVVERPLIAASIPAVDVRSGSILLQKSFWGEEQKFLEPLMRFTRGDVRDHIVSSKIDHGPS